jgi:hypothetical protein
MQMSPTNSEALDNKKIVFSIQNARTYHPFVVVIIGILGIIGIVVSTIVVVHGTLLFHVVAKNG